MKQHTIRNEWIHIVVDCCQLDIWDTCGIGEELRDPFKAACNRNPPCLTTEFLHTVYTAKHDDVVNSVIIVDAVHDNRPQVWMKEALSLLEMATAAGMVEVTAKSHCINSKQFLVHFPHVCYYCNAWRSGTDRIVQYEPFLEYGQKQGIHKP